MSFIETSSEASFTSTPNPKLDAPKSVFFNIGKRTLDRDSIFKSYRADQKMKLSVSKLTDQQVLSSQIYHHLLEQIQKLQQWKTNNQSQHIQKMNQMQNSIKQCKQISHCHKYHVWQLKNQVINLQQEISNEINQYNYLHQWLSGGVQPDQPDSDDFQNKYEQDNGQDEQDQQELGQEFDDKDIFADLNANQAQQEEHQTFRELPDQQQQELGSNQMNGMFSPGFIKRISLRCSQI